MRIKIDKGIFDVVSLEFYVEARINFNFEERRLFDKANGYGISNAIMFHLGHGIFDDMPILLGNLPADMLHELADTILSEGYVDLTKIATQTPTAIEENVRFDNGEQLPPYILSQLYYQHDVQKGLISPLSTSIFPKVQAEQLRIHEAFIDSENSVGEDYNDEV